jgi:translocation and assembly module TamB
LPTPDGPSDGPPITHTLIDLGVRRFAITDGHLDFVGQQTPLHLKGEDLDLSLGFLESRERYQGRIAASSISLETSALEPVPFAFESELALERDQLEMTNGRLAYRESQLSFSSTVTNFAAPEIQVPFEGSLRVADVQREFGLPVEPVGNVDATGEFRFSAGVWSLNGQARGRGLALRSGALRVADVALASRLSLRENSFVFEDLEVDALGGKIVGSASFLRGNLLETKATLAGLGLDRLSRAGGMGELDYHSQVSGDLRLRAEFGPKGMTRSEAEAALLLRPTEGERPLSGEVNVAFTSRDGMLRFRDSLLELPQSHVRVDGDLSEGLRLEAATRSLGDFLPALALVSEQPESLLPISLGTNGELGFRGIVSGTWQNPSITGDLRGKRLRYEDRSLDAVNLRLVARRDHLAVEDLLLNHGDVEGKGNLTLALDAWTPQKNAPLRGDLELRASSLRTILAEAGQQDLPVNGSLTAGLEVRGSLASPEATLQVQVRDGAAYQEQFDEFAVDAVYSTGRLQVTDAHVWRGKGRLELSAEYLHPDNDFRSGTATVRGSLRDFRLRDFKAWQSKELEADARLQGEAALRLRVAGDAVQAEDIRADLQLQGIEYAGKPAGEIGLRIRTESGQAVARLQGKLADSALDGEATVELQGDYPVAGKLALNRLTLDSVRGWLPTSMSQENLPVSMLLVGNSTFSGPLANPESIRASFVVDELRLARMLTGARTLNQERPFELTNSRPIRFQWDGRSLQVVDATIAGTGTSLTLAGSVTPSSERQQMNLRARGDLNFRVFNAFEPSLAAGGSSELDLSVKGTFANPDLYGTLDLKDASIYLTGVPNGLDKVNGRIFLYRDRATIEEITAQSGGGELTFSGFVSYVSGAPTFRLSFRGEDVRVRYPPGVSTSANAALELTGSTEQSILSGVVSITRAAVNPRSDLASILSSSAKPVATPSANQNEFLRNMRFDVQVRTAPDVRFDSTLTQDLSGEADLRLRGNPYNPVLLGKVIVNQGEINFFGNKYFIDRGDISFINPLKLEPVLNLDLRTRVRSIDVTLTFSGPLDKLNVNYRSDPPLQLNEIIALLTVGRAPAGSPSLAEAQNEAAQSWQQVGASALVGQAVAAPIAGRLQKFFGVSRIKIDPRLTGVENNPQARLTVEQQVNRDITVTFITNLAGTQQQIVRLEWNFNPQFSMVALRDEDGLFGIDFLYRKRF